MTLLLGGHFWYPMSSRTQMTADGRIKLLKCGSWATSAGFADFYVIITTSPQFDGNFSNMSCFLLFKVCSKCRDVFMTDAIGRVKETHRWRGLIATMSNVRLWILIVLSWSSAGCVLFYQEAIFWVLLFSQVRRQLIIQANLDWQNPIITAISKRTFHLGEITYLRYIIEILVMWYCVLAWF